MLFFRLNPAYNIYSFSSALPEYLSRMEENNGGSGLHAPTTQDWAALMQQIQELQEERTRDRALLDTIRTQNEDLRRTYGIRPSSDHLRPIVTPTATPDTPSITSAPIPPPPKRKPLPLGSPFSGDKAAFEAWRVTISHKLQVDEAFIGGNREKFSLIWSNLQGNVQKQVANYYARGGQDGQFHPEDFLEFLEFYYGDTHGEERALAHLETLRQGRQESFNDFLPRFVQVMTRAGGDLWPESQKLARLRHCVNQNMRDIALNRGVSRTDYGAAVDTYRSIAVDLETKIIEESYRSRVYPARREARDMDGDTRMTGVAAIGSVNSQLRKGTIQRRKNWIPDELFRQRRQEGVCTRCGDRGHYARGCANAILLTPKSSMNAIGALADDDNPEHEESDSGNE